MGRVREGDKGDVNALGSQIVREIVIPELTKEVNENKNFAKLRQVYNSLILATWYKKKIKDSILEQVYADKNKVAGVNIDDPNEKEKIYQQYLKAFKKGVHNYIKEEIDPLTQETIPRKYFSGGLGFAGHMDDAMTVTTNPESLIDRAQLPQQSLLIGVQAEPFDQAMLHKPELITLGSTFDITKITDPHEVLTNFEFDTLINRGITYSDIFHTLVHPSKDHGFATGLRSTAYNAAVIHQSTLIREDFEISIQAKLGGQKVITIYQIGLGEIFLETEEILEELKAAFKNKGISVEGHSFAGTHYILEPAYDTPKGDAFHLPGADIIKVSDYEQKGLYTNSVRNTGTGIYRINDPLALEKKGGIQSIAIELGVRPRGGSAPLAEPDRAMKAESEGAKQLKAWAEANRGKKVDETQAELGERFGGLTGSRVNQILSDGGYGIETAGHGSRKSLLKETEGAKQLKAWAEVNRGKKVDETQAELGERFGGLTSQRVNQILSDGGYDIETRGKRKIGDRVQSAGDRAMNANGGIDLTPANMKLQAQNADAGIKFQLDPAQLQQLQNAPGFVPVIINIQPMTDLRAFLGLSEANQINSKPQNP